VRCAYDPSPDGTGGETVVDHIDLVPLREDLMRIAKPVTNEGVL
jgi:hypothetical protein